MCGSTSSTELDELVGCIETQIEYRVECGGCGDPFGTDVDEDNEDARKKFAQELKDAGWKVMEAPFYQVIDLFCSECIENEVPTKGDPYDREAD